MTRLLILLSGSETGARAAVATIRSFAAGQAMIAGAAWGCVAGAALVALGWTL